MQEGFSLIELLVALVITVIALQVFYAVSSRVLSDRYNAIRATADFELAQAAFDRFISFYNASATNTALVENLDDDEAFTESPIDLLFDDTATEASGSEIDQTLTINASLDIGNNANDGGLLFSYYVAPSSSTCTLNASGSDYTIACEEGQSALNDWATLVGNHEDFDHFFISVGSSGTLCKVNTIASENWTIESTTDCDDLNTLSFLPPRLVFIAENTLRPYNQTVMDSLADPR